MEEKNVTIKSIATNYGVYLGGLLAILTVLVYAVNLDLMTNMWYGIFVILAIILFGIFSVKKAKEISEGYLTFKQSFTTYFLTLLIGLVISTVVSYIIFNIIDPEAANLLKEKTIETTISFMEGFGAPAEAIAEAVDKIEKDNQFSIGNIATSLAIQLIMFSIVGLIVAAIMKKNPETE
jgi:Ca2+/Na+ antiporter